METYNIDTVCDVNSSCFKKKEYLSPNIINNYGLTDGSLNSNVYLVNLNPYSYITISNSSYINNNISGFVGIFGNSPKTIPSYVNTFIVDSSASNVEVIENANQIQANNVPNLTYIDVCNISDDYIYSFITNNPKLTTINVFGVGSNISNPTLDVSNNPLLTTINTFTVSVPVAGLNCDITFANNSLSQTTVNKILTAVLGVNYNGGTLDITGNGTPDATNLALITSIQAQGVTVLYDP